MATRKLQIRGYTPARAAARRKFVEFPVIGMQVRGLEQSLVLVEKGTASR